MFLFSKYALIKRLHVLKLLSLFLVLPILVSCAMQRTPPVLPGQSEAAVLQRLGTPAGRYVLDGQQYWEYPSWPYGRQTYIAQFSPQGVLVSFTAALNTATFARIKEGVSTKDDVLRIIGSPYERSYLSLPELEVWTYPYLENDVWDSMMHVHFDKRGIVKMMQNGPDERFERENRFMRRMMR